jgi:hypothetical protein
VVHDLDALGAVLARKQHAALEPLRRHPGVDRRGVLVAAREAVRQARLVDRRDAQRVGNAGDRRGELVVGEPLTPRGDALAHLDAAPHRLVGRKPQAPRHPRIAGVQPA